MNTSFYRNLSRIIALQPEYFSDYKPDDVITLKKDTSFAGGDNEEAFQPANDLGGEVVFVVINSCPAHKVDYDNAAEVEERTAVASEDEYIVPKGTHFLIDWVARDEGGQAMLEVELKWLTGREYEEALENGKESEGNI